MPLSGMSFSKKNIKRIWDASQQANLLVSSISKFFKY